MEHTRNPNLFISPRFRPFGWGESRRRREGRTNRNSRFVPESLEARLSLTDLTGAAAFDRPTPPRPSTPPPPPTGPATPY